MQCRICGGQNEDTSRFCVACGIALALRPSPPVAVAAPALQRRGSGSEPRLTVQPPEIEPPPHSLKNAPTSAMALAETAPPAPVPQLRTSPTPKPTWDPATLPPEAPRILVAFLISFEINPLGQYWPIHQGANLIGRQGSGTDLTIEIGHPTTSSRHALLHAATKPSRVLFEDVGSTNGSFVNDHYIPPGIRKDLHDGDVIRLGLFNAVLKLV